MCSRLLLLLLLLLLVLLLLLLLLLTSLTSWAQASPSGSAQCDSHSASPRSRGSLERYLHTCRPHLCADQRKQHGVPCLQIDKPPTDKQAQHTFCIAHLLFVFTFSMMRSMLHQPDIQHMQEHQYNSRLVAHLLYLFSTMRSMSAISCCSAPGCSAAGKGKCATSTPVSVSQGAHRTEAQTAHVLPLPPLLAAAISVRCRPSRSRRRLHSCCPLPLLRCQGIPPVSPASCTSR